MSTLPSPDDGPLLVDVVWDAPRELGSRGRAGTYVAHVPTSISDLNPLIGASAHAAAGRADDALRRLLAPELTHRLDGAARQLLRSEAIASSRIEQHVIGHRGLARADMRGAATGEAAWVLGNLHSLDAAVAGCDEPFGRSELLELHRALFAGHLPAEGWSGRLRTQQNWIGGRAGSPVGAEFVPPPPEYVPALVDDLLSFMARDDLSPVLQAAIVHAQFETIHPFIDGNGRVGRTLVHVVLARRGIERRAFVPFSLHLLARGDRYVRGLTGWRSGDIDDWITFFAEVMFDAAHASESLAERIDVLVARWFEQAGRPRAGSAARRLIERLPSMPIVSVESARIATGASSEGARRAVVRLAEVGVLRPVGDARRNRWWECAGLFSLLDDFERDVLDGRAPGPARTR